MSWMLHWIHWNNFDFSIKTYWKKLKSRSLPISSHIKLINGQICKILSRFVQQTAGHITGKHSLSWEKSLFASLAPETSSSTSEQQRWQNEEALCQMHLAMKTCRFCSMSLPPFSCRSVPSVEGWWARGCEGEVCCGWQERLGKRISNGYLNAYASW